MRSAPALHDVIPDFRSETRRPLPNQEPRSESIQLAAVSKGLSGTRYPRCSKGSHDTTAEVPEEVDRFALRVRSFFNISLQDQVEAKDARAFYVLCRKKIEDKGVFVLHDSFPETDGSGFCLSHSKHPIILVNTKQQTRGRRLFTLIHELAHVLMGKSGVSDPFIRQNKTERLCNRFAGSFHVPEDYIEALLAKSSSGRRT